MAEIIGIQPVGADSIVGLLTELLGLARTGVFRNIAIAAIDQEGTVHTRMPPVEHGLYELVGAVEQLKFDILAHKMRDDPGDD